MAVQISDDKQTRRILRDLLSGKAGAMEELLKLQGPKKDYSHLTPAELTVAKRYDLLRGVNNDFSKFSDDDLQLYCLLTCKTLAETPGRHLLDRVDLTKLSQEELEQAEQVIRMPWVKQFNLPAWLQE